MDSATSDDVLELIDGHIVSAAMGAALEHGLFWLVDAEPMTAAELADSLGISEDRCRPWLQLLSELGYLDDSSGLYSASQNSRTAILDSYSRSTWAFLAGEARSRFAPVNDLARQLRDPRTPWEAQGVVAADYLGRLREDPVWARESTRMVYEAHLPLADAIAESLSMDGVSRVLDVGGGSGVVSFALLRSNLDANAVVLDLEHVCAAGREIAAENSQEDRVEYQTGDFIAHDLPPGFDLIVYCDAGAVDEVLLGKFRAALNPGGRLAIVKFGTQAGPPHPALTRYSLLAALANIPPGFQSVNDVRALLKRDGFRELSVLDLPELETRWFGGWTLIEAGI